MVAQVAHQGARVELADDRDVMFGKQIVGALKRLGKNPVEGLAGVRNLLISVVPLYAMCDRADIGGVVDSKNLGQPTIFLYDRYPGGLGFVEHFYRKPRTILESARELVEECPCDGGCPSCVGLPVLRPAQHQDPDVGGAWPIPDKDAARIILEELVTRAAEIERQAAGGGGTARRVAPWPVPRERTTPSIATGPSSGVAGDDLPF